MPHCWTEGKLCAGLRTTILIAITLLLVPPAILYHVGRSKGVATASKQTHLYQARCEDLETELDYLDQALTSFDFRNARFYVEPNNSEIRKLAKSLGTHEKMYYFVRDKIGYSTKISANQASTVLTTKQASCIGKATLLCSLYRATGVPPDQVHVVMGGARYEGSTRGHTWVEIKTGSGQWLVLDPSPFLGTFMFDSWQKGDYYKTFEVKKIYAFNDAHASAASLDSCYSNNR